VFIQRAEKYLWFVENSSVFVNADHYFD